MRTLRLRNIGAQRDSVTWQSNVGNKSEIKTQVRSTQDHARQVTRAQTYTSLGHTGPLTGQVHSCSGWGARRGSCWWSRRGRRSPGCTGAVGARLAGWAQSPASRSCRQHLRAGRGPWSGPGRSPPPSTLQHAHLCAQSCSMKSPFGGKPQGWCLPGPGSRAQRWRWWREREGA